MAEGASRRPIRAVKKALQGCGHDVHNRRSGQGRPVCRPHRTDEKVGEQQLESVHSSASIYRVKSYSCVFCGNHGVLLFLTVYGSVFLMQSSFWPFCSQIQHQEHTHRHQFHQQSPD